MRVLEAGGRVLAGWHGILYKRVIWARGSDIAGLTLIWRAAEIKEYFRPSDGWIKGIDQRKQDSPFEGKDMYTVILM